jgi:hypothetical protein
VDWLKVNPFMALLAALGCSRNEAAAPPGESATTGPQPSGSLAAATSTAPQTQAPSSASGEATATHVGSDGVNCSPQVAAEIKKGAAVLYSDRESARRHFEAAAVPLSRAYLALMAIEDGDPMAAQGYLAQGTDTKREDVLLVLREAYEGWLRGCASDDGGLPGEERLFACDVYDRPADLYPTVFSSHWGSSADNTMMLVTRYCLAELVGRRLPAVQAKEVLAAEEKVRIRVFRTWEPPMCDGQYCGTMWYGNMIRAGTPLTHVLLAPEIADISRPPGAVAELVKKHASRVPALAGQVRRFRSVLKKHAPALGRGVCAAAKARGHKWSDQRCSDAARRAGEAAMADWLQMRADYPD